MDKQKAISELKACAEYLRCTRLPIGEREAIERLLSCAAYLDRIAKGLEEYETDNEQE